MAQFPFTFTNQTSVTVVHGLGDSNPFWVLYDQSGEGFFPDVGFPKVIDSNTLEFGFGSIPITGTGAVISVLDLVSTGSTVSFTDVQSVKDFKGVTDDSQDSTIARMIAQVSQKMKNYMRRDIVETSFSGEKHDGANQQSLNLKHYPVVGSGVQVTVDDTALAADEFAVCDEAGIVTLIAGTFALGVQNISVDYTGGFVDGVPNDLNLACIKQTCYELGMSGNRGDIRISRAKIEGAVDTTFITTEWAPGVQGTLDLYRRKSLS